MQPTLDDLVAARQIVAEDAPAWEVARWWEKANMFRRGSELPTLVASDAFLLGYQAAFQAATAILRARGFRAHGRTLHHNTFAGAMAITDGAAARAAIELDRLGVVYGTVHRGEPDVSDAQLAKLRRALDELFRECEKVLPAELLLATANAR
jgi:hypothetical protein